jgi:hypothetical protein
MTEHASALLARRPAPLPDKERGALLTFADGFDVGVDAGLVVGFRQGWTAHVDRVQARFGLAVLDEPTRGELARLREVDHRPCAARCRRCSRCIHSLAYYGRGGRDYLGVEAERRLAKGIT